ncbi:hypothetical protein D7V88_06295 [Corallococcus terminator]|uniref:Acyltransferase n=1 Tax=Corallococcus terminator TaxID=2316733 RepID=A0A3A8JAA4_9BACT|nr:hypothetical protein D7V88_06295 [Corallococcus terminator]
MFVIVLEVEPRHFQKGHPMEREQRSGVGSAPGWLEAVDAMRGTVMLLVFLSHFADASLHPLGGEAVHLREAAVGRACVWRFVGAGGQGSGRPFVGWRRQYGVHTLRRRRS